MDQKDAQPSHLPVEPADIELRAYHIALAFHPPIRLERKKGFEFAAALSDYIDPSAAQLEGHEWKLSQPISGSPRSTLDIVIRKGQIEVGAAFPGHSKEWLEDRFSAVLRRFAEGFGPEIILSSAALVRVVLQIDGDAREFLATRVMKLHPGRADSLGRPIHLVGLRFFFPPFSLKGTEGQLAVTEWQVDVKVESLLEDPGKLFLEADGRWPKALCWDVNGEQQVVGRLRTVSDYLQEHVVGFLSGRADAGAEDS